MDLEKLTNLLGQLVSPAVYRPDPNDPRDPIPQDERKKFQVHPVRSESGFAPKGPSPEEIFRQKVDQWKQHIKKNPYSTPPFVPSEAYNRARNEVGFGNNPLVNLLQQLQQLAQPRPDLVQGGRPATFAGRVITGGETPAQVLASVPTGELESGGQALASLPAVGAAASLPRLAKTFKPGPNLDDPAIAIKFLRDKIAAGELTPRQVQAMSSTQGGRAGVLLPDGQIKFAATHGDAMRSVPEAIRGQIKPEHQVMDVQTPYGRSLVSIGDLDKLFQMK